MKNATRFEDLLVEKYGEKGTVESGKFDSDLLSFRLGIMLKEAGKSAQLTCTYLVVARAKHEMKSDLSI